VATLQQLCGVCSRLYTPPGLYFGQRDNFRHDPWSLACPAWLSKSRMKGEEEPMPSNVVNLHGPASMRGGLAVAPEGPAESGARSPDGVSRESGGRSMSLHVSKLRGISVQVRNRLKRQGITYTHQLLEAAGRRERRRALAARSGIEDAVLLRLTCRADLARVKGIGAIFADMLELVGVDRVANLARHEPARLYGILQDLNAAERFARRAPTQEEVVDWIAQARSLPQLVDREP
jgi:predicted flap endonuclease-1-like 5' DNA nuclease